ncbi:MAG TPA: sulfotransferase [Sphingomonas sp.]|uniref:tetratricopeptide repeat-containing sulfotransferase family protein n=1 Tax=Sphingomonas sp. TaxID=28214 RepID=UPI002B9350F7|nr:sulfotransferase [Sphingomonas sp.]HMI19407.1 sulfotransferase [Sphingomonas sp.]
MTSSELDQALTAGATHLREGRAQEAEAAFAQATRLMPEAAAAWRGLGNSLHALGQTNEGGAAHLRALQLSAKDPELAKAAQAIGANRLSDAYPWLRDRLQAEPSDIAALRMMADVAMRMGRPIDAARMLIRAIELAPDFTIARQLLLDALLQAPSEDALAELDQRLASKPDHLGYLNLKANLLDRAGRYDEAIVLYRRMLDIRPDAVTWITLGNVLQTIGRSAESVDCYRRSIALAPQGGEAWWSLANAKTFAFSPDDVAQLRVLTGLPDLPVADRLQAEFALGKALEDAGDYAEAFERYAAGNRLRHGMVRYNQAQMGDQLRRAARLYTPDFFAERAGAGDPAPDPIFIVGLPRSGSTLVEQILASHSQIEGTMELNDLLRIVRKLDLPGGRYPEMLATVPAAQLAALGQDFLQATRIQRKAGRPFFIDKLPVNFMHIGLIRTILPNAKIIDVRRHPLSCGWSCFKQHFARGHDFSYDLRDIGAYYRTYIGFMALWDAVLPGHVHRIFYEDLVADTESEVRRLLDTLGLPFEPGCLAFHRTERAVRTPSAQQVRQPIFTGGLDQWRKFDPWLGPLKHALGDVLDAYPAIPDTLRP